MMRMRLHKNLVLLSVSFISNTTLTVNCKARIISIFFKYKFLNLRLILNFGFLQFTSSLSVENCICVVVDSGTW